MVKGFIIAGTHSGCGKTTLTLGILRTFKNRGIKVQPFKIGPDYIDTSWHKNASGVDSVNLDLFSMGEEIEAWFWKYAKNSEICVIEGVMGLFDGDFSTFEVAKKLKFPIILVIDTFGMAETVYAIVVGFKEILSKEKIEFYLVLNKVSSQKHLTRLLNSLKKFKVLGFIPKNIDFEIPSRHLGLYMPGHEGLKEEKLQILSEVIEKNIDLTTLLTLKSSKDFSQTKEPKIKFDFKFSSIGIALDSAFCFYYTHIIDMLKEKYKVKFFSPLKDKNLPDEVSAIYLGGGYPELYAEILSENSSMRKNIKTWAEEGLPIYAECGGLIYLSKELHFKNKTYPMCEVLPVLASMDGLHLGYKEIEVLKNTPFFKEKTKFKGHEFHYTKIKELKPIEKVYRIVNQNGALEGYFYKNVLASYVHFIN